MKDHESFWTGLFLKHSHTVAWLQPLQTSCVTPWPADHCCRSTNRPETIKKRDESVSAPGGDRDRVSRGPEHCAGNLILGNLPCDLFSSVQCVSPDLTSCTCRRSSSGFKTQQKDWRQMDVWCLSHHSEGVTLVKQQQEQHLLHLLLVVNTFPNDLRSNFFIFSPCKVQWVFKKTQKYPSLLSKLPHLLDCFFWASLGAERSDFTLPTEQTPSEQPCCFVWMVPPDWSGSRSHREPWSAHKPATPPALCFSSPLHLMLQICPPMNLKKEKC